MVSQPKSAGTQLYILIPEVPKEGAHCCFLSGYLLVSKGANPQWEYEIYKIYIIFFITYVAFNLLLPFLFLHKQCCMYYLDFR